MMPATIGDAIIGEKTRGKAHRSGALAVQPIKGSADGRFTPVECLVTSRKEEKKT